MRFPIPNMDNLNGQVDFYRNIFCARHSFRLFSAACGTFISSELLRFFRNDPTGRISHHVYNHVCDLDGDSAVLPTNPKDRVLGFKMF